MASSTAAVNAATRPSWSRRKYGIATIEVPISAGARRAVKDRHVLVVALGPQDPGEIRVLALVVVERPVAEVVEPQRQRHGDQDDVGDQLAARAPHRRAARRRAIPP